jgi:cell division inhibitor SulA
MHSASYRSLKESDKQESLLTELILSGSHSQQRQLLLPMLAHMTQQSQDQWLTLIAPADVCEQLIVASELKALGADAQKIRILKESEGENLLWLTWEALTLGNSHTVVAWPGKIKAQSRTQLESAAQSGQSRCLLLRSF